MSLLKNSLPKGRFFFLNLLFLVAASIAHGETQYVTYPIGVISSKKQVELKNKPSKDGKKAGAMNPGEHFAVYKKGDWFLILDGPSVELYVEQASVKLLDENFPLARSVGQSIRVRAIPGTNGRVVGMVNSSEIIAVDKQGDWFQIKDGRYRGYYISEQFFRLLDKFEVFKDEPETLANLKVVSEPPAQAAPKDPIAAPAVSLNQPFPPLPVKPSATSAPTSGPKIQEKTWNSKEEERFNNLADKAFKTKKKASDNPDDEVIMPLIIEGEKQALGQIRTKPNTDSDLVMEAQKLKRILQDYVDPKWFSKSENQKKFENEWIHIKEFENGEFKLIYSEAKLNIQLILPLELKKEGVSKILRSGSGQSKIAPEAPAFFSSYLNIDTSQVFDTRNANSESDTRSPLRAQLENGTRLGSFNLEAYGSYVEQRSADSTVPAFTRQDVRVIRDFSSELIRTSFGDLNYPTTGFQSFRSMAGFSMTRKFYMSPSKLTFPSGSYELFLQRNSKVFVWINNQMVQVLDLPAGKHSIQDFPFASGVNEIRFEIVDDVGRTETVNYSYFSSAELLKPGLHQFSYAVGAPSTTIDSQRIYDSSKTTVSAFHRYGISETTSAGVNIQNDNVQTVFGLEYLLSTTLGFFKTEAAYSHYLGAPDGAAVSEFFFFTDQVGEEKLQRTFNLGLKYQSETFALLGSPGFDGTRRNYELSTGYSQPLSKFSSLSYGLSYNINKMGYLAAPAGVDNSFTITLGVNRRWDSGLGVSGTLRHNRTERGDEDVSASVFMIWSMPKEKQVVTALHNTTDSSTRADWSYSPDNGTGAVKYLASTRDGQSEKGYSGGLDYNGNRARSSLTYEIILPKERDGTAAGTGGTKRKSDQITTLQLGTSLLFADGYFSLSRPVTDSFAIIAPVKNLKGQPLQLNPETQGSYLARTDGWGNAALPELSSYNQSTIIIGGKEVPPELTIPRDHFDIYPPYKSGYAFAVGTDATIYLSAKIFSPDGLPLTAAGRAVYLDDLSLEPIIIFMNRKGILRSEGFRPGRYRLEILTDDYQVFNFEIPKASVGDYDLGDVHLLKK